MSDYRIRPATLADEAVLAHHRAAMFEEMGVDVDRPVLDAAFRPWLRAHMPQGQYRAWLVEAIDGSVSGSVGGSVVSGGGITVLPWPPGPRYLGDRLAFVYNVFTEPGHRRRGLGRLVMHAIHDYCRQEGIQTLALNASRAGQPLYEALGYAVTPSPMMFLALD